MKSNGAGIREQLTAIREKTKEYLVSGMDGRSIVKFISAEVDALLLGLWESVINDMPEGKTIDVLAVGGYGRAELCPYSDWDLLFLVDDAKDTAVTAAIEKLLYLLWDANVPLGYAVRTVSECKKHCKDDVHATTALLESRLLYGQGRLYHALHRSSHEFWKGKERLIFCQKKIDELRARRRAMGNTPFLMEPKIKEGQGGLRDVSSLFWLCMAWYGVPSARQLIKKGIVSHDEFETFIESRNFLFKVRIATHLAAGREQDALSFDEQFSIAKQFHYKDNDGKRGVEVFMRDYFTHVRHISDLMDIFLLHFKEQMYPKRFQRKRSLPNGLMLKGDAVGIADEAVFLSTPLNFFRIFIESQQAPRYLDSHARRFIRSHAALIDENVRQDSAANALFLEIFRSSRYVATALKQMHETGVLGNFVPDFSKITAHGQFDRYHVYTVDAHTLRAIDVLRDICLEVGEFTHLPVASQLVQRIERPEILYLALLFHDIAKGRGGDHSILGETLAFDECRRFGLNEESANFVAWLVRSHLLMAKTSQRYDLTDPEVIDHFAHQVEDLDHLDHLFLLTIADVTAVGPKVWTSWKEQLLFELYHVTRDYMQAGQVHTNGRKERAHRRKQDIIACCASDIKQSVHAALETMPVSFLLYFSSEQITFLTGCMVQSSKGVAYQVDNSCNHTRFYVWADDQEGLFAHLTAALSLRKVRVLAAQAFNLSNGAVMDEFILVRMDQNVITEPSDLEKIKKCLMHVVDGIEPLNLSEVQAPALDILAKQLPVTVCQLDKASSKVTVIQVTAADRSGLLAKLAMMINDLGLEMKGANINTFGEKAIDVFFLTDKYGNKLSIEKTKQTLEALQQAAKV